MEGWWRAGDIGPPVFGPRGGRVELRRHPVRAPLRQPALRRREHPQPLQKDQGASKNKTFCLSNKACPKDGTLHPLSHHIFLKSSFQGCRSVLPFQAHYCISSGPRQLWNTFAWYLGRNCISARTQAHNIAGRHLQPAAASVPGGT